MGYFRFFLTLLISLGVGVSFAGNSQANGKRDLTGTWETPRPSPYVHQITIESPEFFTTSMTWTLEENSDGMISGTNEYIAYDSDGATIAEGVQNTVGVREGRKFSMAQADATQLSDTGMTFQCTRKSRHKISCLGTSTGTLAPLGLKAILVRSAED